MVAEKFQIYSVKATAKFNFTHAPKQSAPPGFHHYPPGWRELCIPPNSIFWRYFFLSRKREGGEDYVVEKIAKINKGIGHKFW